MLRSSLVLLSLAWLPLAWGAGEVAEAPAPPPDAPAADPTPEAAPAPPPVLAPQAAPAQVAVAAPPAPTVEAKAPSPSDEPATFLELLGKKSPFSLLIESQFRRKAILDTTPLNDMLVVYDFVLRYQPTPQHGAFVIGEFIERFVAEVGDSAWRFSDLQVGGRYRHKLSLAGLGLPYFAERPLSLSYSVRAWLPTSRASINQSLVFAPDVRATARFPVLGEDRLTALADLRAVYRINRFALAPGPRAPGNNRFIVSFDPSIESAVAKFGRWGSLWASAGVSWIWANRYPSSESYVAASSVQSPWVQVFGWELAVAYQPKPWARLGLSFEQNGNVRRNGFYRPILAHRDETELVAKVTLTF